MAAPFFSTPFQPYVYQSPQDAVIPFQILGGEAQLVQIMLKPEEKVIAKPGSMCFMSGSMEMENVFVPENEGSMWQWIFGKTVSSIVFCNAGPGDGFVGIAAPSLARVLPVGDFKGLFGIELNHTKGLAAAFGDVLACGDEALVSEAAPFYLELLFMENSLPLHKTLVSVLAKARTFQPLIRRCYRKLCEDYGGGGAPPEKAPVRHQNHPETPP